MNSWSILFVFIIICIVLLIICYILMDKVERQDKRCSNCRKKTIDDWYEITCKNKRSNKYGAWVDEFDCCSKWKG
jgi:hypothetical protein